MVLLLDSSDKCLAVGLAQGGILLDGVSYEAWQKQSELMIPEIDRMLAKHSLSREDLEGVVVTRGPGSYTGVRIAMTIAKTISFACEIPLYLVSSLEAMKEEGKASLCLMNARGKRSYVGVYRDGQCLLADCIKTNEEVLALIQEHPEYAVCGDVEYLGIEGKSYHSLAILASCTKKEYLCEEPLGARPIYLKDDYDAGRFKTVVRKMMPYDLEAVLSIEQSSFHHPYDEAQMLYEMNENPVAYLYTAVVDNEVVGFIDFYITFDSCSIAQIAVKEEFRSKGIGNLLIGQLIKDCESKADPVEFVTLEVRASNERAIKFYKRHKFQLITTKKSYYEDGEDAIYMVRNITRG